MQAAMVNEMRARGEILADALDQTIAELRLIDAGHMISYIRAGQWANISDLVQSSAELSFADGAVSFAYFGDYEMSWGDGPSIVLDMEFQSGEVTAFFTLTMAPTETRVRVNDILFTSAPGDERSATRVFAQALDAARRAALR